MGLKEEQTDLCEGFLSQTEWEAGLQARHLGWCLIMAPEPAFTMLRRSVRIWEVPLPPLNFISGHC